MCRVSYPGQPCEYTSNEWLYTRQRAKLAVCIASAIPVPLLSSTAAPVIHTHKTKHVRKQWISNRRILRIGCVRKRHSSVPITRVFINLGLCGVTWPRTPTGCLRPPLVFWQCRRCRRNVGCFFVAAFYSINFNNAPSSGVRRNGCLQCAELQEQFGDWLSNVSHPERPRSTSCLGPVPPTGRLEESTAEELPQLPSVRGM